MVTAKTQYNLKNAEEYFEEHLAVGDYYDEGQRITGEWIGLGARISHWTQPGCIDVSNESERLVAGLRRPGPSRRPDCSQASISFTTRP